MRYTVSTRIADRQVTREVVEAADPIGAATELGRRYAADVVRSGFIAFDVEVRDEGALHGVEL